MNKPLPSLQSPTEILDYIAEMTRQLALMADRIDEPELAALLGKAALACRRPSSGALHDGHN